MLDYSNFMFPDGKIVSTTDVDDFITVTAPDATVDVDTE
jgi:hypothetical protein